MEKICRIHLCGKTTEKTIPLGQMWILATDGDHGSPDYQESGVLYLLSECVKEGYIEKAKCRYITEAKNRELKRSCLHPGDIVVTKTGVYFGKALLYRRAYLKRIRLRM